MAAQVVRVGNVEIVGLIDLVFPLDYAILFPGRDVQAIMAFQDVYPQSYTPDGRYQTYASCYVVRSGGKTVLVDTGLGPNVPSFLGGGRGRLLEELSSNGISPEDVDVVVCTHLHLDHTGWNAREEGGVRGPTFPRARYYLPRADWEHFTAPERIDGAAGRSNLLPLQEAGVMELFSGEVTLAEGVTTLPTPGHTPGHSSILISSQGERALIAGDLVNHPLQIEKVDWSSAFDTDPAQAAETRRRILDFVESEGLRVAFGHLPPPNMGRLIRLEGRRVLRAL